MRKGRFGVVLCLYPILAFSCVILNQPIICAAIFAIALLAERDEWAGRQTLQALMLSVVTSIVRGILWFVITRMDLNFFIAAMGAASAMVYLIAIVVSILAILRVMRDQEANLPLLADLAMRAYGKRKPRPQPPIPGQYPPPPFTGQVPPTYQRPGQQPPQQPPIPPQPPQPGPFNGQQPNGPQQ